MWEPGVGSAPYCIISQRFCLLCIHNLFPTTSCPGRMQQPASAWTAVQGAYTASIQTGEKTQKNKKPEAAYWIPQYCPMCFVLVLLKSIFWLLARLLKAQRILFKLQEVANLTYLRSLLSQSRSSNSKGTSQSVRHTPPRR